MVTPVTEKELKENEDYYINEDGQFVFTKAYHLNRGFCCENACTHCPFGFNKNQDDSN